MGDIADVERLDKQLGLFDVYAISTGAMMSSGFFLLPGIAAANAGPSVVLAYALSSLLMVPSVLSIAELSSAMPRAAGTYFFIHRSMGPWAGTVGGFGDWFVLSFKSAFALVGMGAYIVLFFDVPMVPLAVALVVAFGAINILGAKETAFLQKALVVTLIAIMAYYCAQGLVYVTGATGFVETAEQRFTPLLPFGAMGLVSTIGIVFISYAGLTKVAAAAEEIEDLDRNLPLGMFLALASVAAIYVVGVGLMVATLEPETLRADLTPVATAGAVFLDWLPGPVGVLLVVIAAIAAFASTGNAGILTASRYPLAMARDELVWSGFDRIGRFGTPTVGILATCGVMITAIVFLDVERLASLGSAFVMLIFALVNLSVIIMRESRIDAYAPGFRSPWYPWLQLIAIVAMIGLIVILGRFYVIFVLAIITLTSIWYVVYARGRVEKRGAIFSLFGRLSRIGDPGIDLELWRLLQERGTSDEDSYEELVARAHVVDLEGTRALEEVFDEVAAGLAEMLFHPEEHVRSALSDAQEGVITPGGGRTAIYEAPMDDLEHPALAMVRIPGALRIGAGREFPGQDPDGDDDGTEHSGDRRRSRVNALIFLVSPRDRMTQHLRILAELATQVDEPDFHRRWRTAEGEAGLKEALLRHERFITLDLRRHDGTDELVGRRIRDIRLPGNSLVALVRRDDQSIFPRGRTRLRQGDRITVIGPSDDVQELYERFRPT